MTPVMYLDPSGEFFIALSTIALIAGAIVGATAGSIIAYNIAKNNGAEGLVEDFCDGTEAFAIL